MNQPTEKKNCMCKREREVWKIAWWRSTYKKHEQLP